MDLGLHIMGLQVALELVTMGAEHWENMPDGISV